MKLCKAADAQGTFVSVHLIKVSTKYRFVLLKIWEEPFETYWAIYPHNSEGSLLNMGFAYNRFHCNANRSISTAIIVILQWYSLYYTITADARCNNVYEQCRLLLADWYIWPLWLHSVWCFLDLFLQGKTLFSYWTMNKNALKRIKSCLLRDKIRNKKAVRLPAVVLLSSEPRVVSDKVKLCSWPTVT